MKGQITLEELLSFGVYLFLLSLLIAAVFTAKDTGVVWSSKVELRQEANSLATTHDAFYNSNLYNPEPWEGGGAGYVETKEDTGVPVLEGSVEVANGEAI